MFNSNTKLVFQFIILGTGEAVFSIDGEHKIYTIAGIRSLEEQLKDNPTALEELMVARAHLFDDVLTPTK